MKNMSFCSVSSVLLRHMKSNKTPLFYTYAFSVVSHIHITCHKNHFVRTPKIHLKIPHSTRIIKV